MPPFPPDPEITTPAVPAPVPDVPSPVAPPPPLPARTCTILLPVTHDAPPAPPAVGGFPARPAEPLRPTTICNCVDGVTANVAYANAPPPPPAAALVKIYVPPPPPPPPTHTADIVYTFAGTVKEDVPIVVNNDSLVGSYDFKNPILNVILCTSSL
jgi:hypothetical protein